MARLPDEQWAFIEDSIEKKNIARSAHNTRTHCGKSGRVKFPSDYLSKKELKAMNGECKSYRLNAPMTWPEFRDMPDDLKVTYVKSLREKYKVSDGVLADCLGVTRHTFGNYIRCLGLGLGKGAGATSKFWEKTEDYGKFMAWWHGAPAEKKTDEASVGPVEQVEPEICKDDQVREEYVEAALTAIGEAAATVMEEMENKERPSDKAFAKYAEHIEEEHKAFENKLNKVVPDELIGKEIDTYPNGITIPCAGPIVFTGHHMPVIPKSGNMTFENDLADDALDIIKCLLSNVRVNLRISWECVSEDGVVIQTPKIDAPFKNVSRDCLEKYI